MKKDFLLKDLLYLQEHRSCTNYVPNMNSGFKYNELEQGSNFMDCCMEKNSLLFVVGGRLSVSFNADTPCHVCQGEMTLLPKGVNVLAKALTNVQLLSLSFDVPNTECSLLMLQEACAGQPARKNDPCVLPGCESIDLFLQLLRICLKRQVFCFHFHEIMEQELFLLLRYNYTKEEIARLFYPIGGKDLSFKDFVLQNYRKVNSVAQLVELSNMGKSAFAVKFKEVFGVTAKQWMVKQMNDQIRYLFCQPGASVKEVMYKLKFESHSNFTRYCLRQFGCTPRQLLAKYTTENEGVSNIL